MVGWQPPHIVGAVGSTLWAVTWVAALTVSLHPRLRPTVWWGAWAPGTVLSLFWCATNWARVVGAITRAQYLELVAPLIPALFVSLASVGFAFTLRARRLIAADRAQRAIMGAVGDT